MVVALRRSPAIHRVSLDEVAPSPKRVRAAQAMAEFRSKDLTEIGADDLEAYRLVMSPGEFRRMCVRLDREILALYKSKNEAAWGDTELPFGADVEADWKRERLRAWCDRPNGEPFPASWSVEVECQIPGRLKLVAGREFTVRGVRGRMRFRHAVRTDGGEFWLECWDTEGRYRSVRPERVRVVHSKAKTRPALARLAR